MPQSLSSILVHFVFSTKHREPFITGAVESELHPYMATIFREHDSPSLIIDGTADQCSQLVPMKHKQEAQAKKPRDSRGFATNGVIVIAGKMLALPR